jgi:hypothetical protein
MDIDWDTAFIAVMALMAWWNLHDATRHLRSIDETLKDLREHFVPEADLDEGW